MREQEREQVWEKHKEVADGQLKKQQQEWPTLDVEMQRHKLQLSVLEPSRS